MRRTLEVKEEDATRKAAEADLAQQAAEEEEKAKRLAEEEAKRPAEEEANRFTAE